MHHSRPGFAALGRHGNYWWIDRPWRASAGSGGWCSGNRRWQPAGLVFEEALAEQHRLPIVVTEGFGQGGMAERAFDVLRQCEGLEARLAGGTLGNPTDLPEVVVPVDAPSAPRPKAPSLELGAAVRIVAGPRAFAVGTVASVGAEPRAFPGGVVDRWCAVALDDEQEVVVPRMNVELVGG